MLNIKKIYIIILLFNSFLIFSNDYDIDFWNHISSGNYDLAGDYGSSIGHKKPQYHLLSSMAYIPSNNQEKMDQQYHLFIEKAENYPPSLIEKEFNYILNKYSNDSNIISFIGVFTWTYKDLIKIDGEKLIYRSLEIDPENFVSNNYISVIEYNKGNWEKALQHALTSIQNSKNYSEPYVNASNAYIELIKKDSAIEIIFNCFKNCTNPHQNAYLSLFYLLGESGSGIVQNFNQTLMAPTLNFEYKNLDKIYDQIKHSEIIYYTLVSNLIDKGSYGAANYLIKNSNEVIKDKEKILYLRLYLSFKSYAEDDFNNSLLEYQRLDHANKQILVKVARMSLQFSKFDIAVKQFEELIQFKGVKKKSYEIMTYYSSLGLINAELGDLDKGNYYWDLALDINPNDNITLTNKEKYNN